MPTMMRKLQNTMVALDRSCGGQALRPFTVPFQSWVKIKLPTLGNSTV